MPMWMTDPADTAILGHSDLLSEHLREPTLVVNEYACLQIWPIGPKDHKNTKILILSYAGGGTDSVPLIRNHLVTN